MAKYDYGHSPPPDHHFVAMFQNQINLTFEPASLVPASVLHRFHLHPAAVHAVL